MAAEKLTRGRLIQILIMMALLITAFTWRTVEFFQKNPMQSCELEIGECRLSDPVITVQYIEPQEADERHYLFVKSAKKIDSVSLIGSDSEGGRLTWASEEKGNNVSTKISLPSDFDTSKKTDVLIVVDQDQIKVNFKQ